MFVNTLAIRLSQLSITVSFFSKLIQKLSSLIKHFHTVIFEVSYNEFVHVKKCKRADDPAFWATVSKLKHRFNIHCKHLNSAVLILHYNDKTFIT